MISHILQLQYNYESKNLCTFGYMVYSLHLGFIYTQLGFIIIIKVY